MPAPAPPKRGLAHALPALPLGACPALPLIPFWVPCLPGKRLLPRLVCLACPCLCPLPCLYGPQAGRFLPFAALAMRPLNTCFYRAKQKFQKNSKKGLQFTPRRRILALPARHRALQGAPAPRAGRKGRQKKKIAKKGLPKKARQAKTALTGHAKGAGPRAASQGLQKMEKLHKKACIKMQSSL